LRSEKTPRRGSLPGKGNALSGAQPSPPPQRFVRRFGGGSRPRLGGRLRGQRAEVPQAQPSSSPAGQRGSTRQRRGRRLPRQASGARLASVGGKGNFGGVFGASARRFQRLAGSCRKGNFGGVFGVSARRFHRLAGSCRGAGVGELCKEAALQTRDATRLLWASGARPCGLAGNERKRTSFFFFKV